jgi:alkanesulfonate monooxygenase SsuD/methylene tetrahydromethanopterin reductase-like flavin-dependent oxidoreductase (luciferase family)
MRFHYAEAMTAVANYIPLAQAAEANGYAGYVIPDSLIYPKASDTEYSYTEDGGREFLENKPFVESFIMATAIGTATKTLEMTTNVVKLPVRPPLYTAKLVSSIAALTNDRFNLGVGLSVWPEDYKAMGVDFAKRGKRFDECIDIVRGLCAGGYFEYHGEFYDLDPVKLNPLPGKPLPILIGGFSEAALKRAARNDGFMHAGNGTREEMAAMFAKIHAYRAEFGTADKPFRIFATAMGEMTLDAVKRNQDIGVTDMPIAFRNLYAVEEDSQPLEQKFDDMKRFADQVIAKL